MSKLVVKKEINLLEETVFPLGVWDKLYLWAINAGRFFMMIIEISTILLFFVHIIYDQQLISVQEHIKSSMYTLDTLKADEANIRAVASVLDSIKKLQDYKHSMYELNNKIYSFLPGGIILKQVSINDLSVTLDGISLGYAPMKKLLDNLKQSALIKPDSIRVTTNQKQSGDITFDLTFEFKE